MDRALCRLAWSWGPWGPLGRSTHTTPSPGKGVLCPVLVWKGWAATRGDYGGDSRQHLLHTLSLPSRPRASLTGVASPQAQPRVPGLPDPPCSTSVSPPPPPTACPERGGGWGGEQRAQGACVAPAPLLPRTLAALPLSAGGQVAFGFPEMHLDGSSLQPPRVHAPHPE